MASTSTSAGNSDLTWLQGPEKPLQAYTIRPSGEGASGCWYISQLPHSPAMLLDHLKTTGIGPHLSFLDQLTVLEQAAVKKFMKEHSGFVVSAFPSQSGSLNDHDTHEPPRTPRSIVLIVGVSHLNQVFNELSKSAQQQQPGHPSASNATASPIAAMFVEPPTATTLSSLSASGPTSGGSKTIISLPFGGSAITITAVDSSTATIGGIPLRLEENVPIPSSGTASDRGPSSHKDVSKSSNNAAIPIDHVSGSPSPHAAGAAGPSATTTPFSRFSTASANPAITPQPIFGQPTTLTTNKVSTNKAPRSAPNPTPPVVPSFTFGNVSTNANNRSGFGGLVAPGNASVLRGGLNAFAGNPSFNTFRRNEGDGTGEGEGADST